MVALLRPHTGSPFKAATAPAPPGGPARLRLVVDNTGPVGRRPIGSSAVESGPIGHGHAGAVAGIRPLVRTMLDDAGTVLALAAVTLVILGGLMVVRLSQGSAPASTWEDLGATASNGIAAAAVLPTSEHPSGGLAGTDRTNAAASALSPGGQVVVAEPGDSLWSIARQLAPNADPRPLVAALADANGGETVRVGQQIVIPVQLLD